MRGSEFNLLFDNRYKVQSNQNRKKKLTSLNLDMAPQKPEVWDSKTQTFHGGQEHRFIDNFLEDFSVTTNYLGTPKPALVAAREAVSSTIFCVHS